MPTLPLVVECTSTSYLPAASPFRVSPDSRQLLSQASQLKRKEPQTHGRTLWSGWIEYLNFERKYEEKLRPSDLEDVGDDRRRRRRGDIGLVYADGNAMGRLVQELPNAKVYREFSHLVDESVRKACYRALQHVCKRDITEAQDAIRAGKSPRYIPADILLLGGDDLVVILPSDRGSSSPCSPRLRSSIAPGIQSSPSHLKLVTFSRPKASLTEG